MNHPAADQIVDIGSTLGYILQSMFSCQDIMVNNVGAMAYFYKQIPVILIEQIFTDSCPLGLPIQP
ncbi:hypothetical protein D3C75_567240 [compost metagenome]